MVLLPQKCSTGDGRIPGCSFILSVDNATRNWSRHALIAPIDLVHARYLLTSRELWFCIRVPFQNGRLDQNLTATYTRVMMHHRGPSHGSYFRNRLGLAVQ